MSATALAPDLEHLPASLAPLPLAKALPSGPLCEEDDDFDSDGDIAGTANALPSLDYIREIRQLETSPRKRMPNALDEHSLDYSLEHEVPVVDGTELEPVSPALGNLQLDNTTPADAVSPELVPAPKRRTSRSSRNSYSRIPTLSDDADDDDDTKSFLRQPTATASGSSSAPLRVEGNKAKSSRALVTSRLKKGFKAVKRASAKSTSAASKSINAAWRANQPPPKNSRAQNSADREEWLHTVLPAWKKRRRAARTRVLMFRGIPSSVRGVVWQTALGNPLNVSADLYEVLKERALAGRAEYTRFQEFCANGGDLNGHGMLEHQRSAHKAILLDLPRTFPGLAFFHADGSNYEDALRDILEAFVYLRPDVGYSQGMSFLAAVLLLFMEPPEAFSCFVNMLLYKSCFLQFFRIQMPDVRIYLDVHSRLLAEEMPALHAHFVKHAVEPDIYMINWVMSLYCRALPLDLVSRIWDIYVFDGDVAIFRAALGILKLLQPRLLVMNFEEIAYSLSHLPTDDIQDDALMHTIRSVRVVTKKRFKELYRECQVKYNENPQAK